MKLDLTLLTAATALVVGFIAFWSNPKRAINRVFLTLSLHAAVWLVSLRTAIVSEHGLFWLRVTSSIGAFIPLHLWFVKETIVSAGESIRQKFWRSRWWALGTLLLAVVPFTEWFIPGRVTHSAKEMQVYGWGYYAYTAGVVLAYLALVRETVLQMRAKLGVSRLELQIVLLGGSATVGTILLLMVLRAVLGLPWLIRLQPPVVLLFYTATVIAIGTHRIFDARQIMRVGLQKFTLIALVAGVAFAADWGFGQLLPEPVAFLAMTAVALWFAGMLNAWLNSVLQFYPQATALRQAAFAVARREARGENMEQAFLAILKGWGQTDHALVLSGAAGPLRGGGVELPADGAIVQTLRSIRWATPERLAREKSTPGRDELANFLASHGLGVAVIGEGPTLLTLVGVGVAASRQPFTYPQVTQLLELASIIENALERAHFSIKAQHAEQLATVGLLGASLAHEIRNPLVTIKTFVQLLPQHHEDPAFRDKFFRLIGDEVSRIDRLTEQLLDLAAPRAYTAQMVNLHPVLSSSLDLVAAKSEDKRIRIISDFQANPDRACTDVAAAKQVLLNLCFNAIQAVEAREGERWVKISTRNAAAGLEMAVEDSGPGVAPGMLLRIFQPFQSSKSTGFGLGLAICSDILTGLNATITVDPPVAGRGAVFRVTFPCQAFSS